MSKDIHKYIATIIFCLATWFLPLEATQEERAGVMSNSKQESIGVTFFVAPDGNDAWSGKLAAVDREHKNGPFATLSRAREAVRTAKNARQDHCRPITVMIRGGRYYLSETLSLERQDGGTENCPVTWRAYPGEKPVLSGGRRISGWKPYKDQIVQTELPAVKLGSWKFDQLFFNGQRQIRSRTPNYDPKNPLYGGWAIMQGLGDKFGGGIDAFKYPSGLFKARIQKPALADVYFFRHGSHASSTNHLTSIKSIDYEKSLIYTDYAPENPILRFGTNNRFRIENVLEELDQPGEWSLDTEEGVLYFWPPGDLENAVVVAPLLCNLIELRDTAWMVISGLGFTETANRWPAAGYSSGEQGSAILLRNAQHCIIADNSFHGVGQDALDIIGRQGNCDENLIQNNEISMAGGWGIRLSGSVRHNRILDNDIHHCGVINKRASAIEFACSADSSGKPALGGFPDRNLVAHNDVHDMPRDGIHLGVCPSGSNIVEYNWVHRTALETIDNGGIRAHRFSVHLIDNLSNAVNNTTMDGHVIRYNQVIDPVGCSVSGGKIIVPTKWPNMGIYLDEGTSNCLLYGNTVVRAGVGILINPGKSNVIENNIFIDCSRCGIAFQVTQQLWEVRDLMVGNRIAKNIFYSSNPSKMSIFALYAGSNGVVTQSESNLFYFGSQGDGIVHLSKGPNVWSDARALSLADWQKMGYDFNSLVSNPLFSDPQQDDYRLLPDSPALQLGFVPIDMDKVGRRDYSRAKSQR